MIWRKKINMDFCNYFLLVYESDLYLEYKFIFRKEIMNLFGRYEKNVVFFLCDFMNRV